MLRRCEMRTKIQFSELIPGTLVSVKEKGGAFWHLTWKEKQKTKTRYIRISEVDKVKKGIRAYKKAKTTIDKVAKANLAQLFKKRK